MRYAGRRPAVLLVMGTGLLCAASGSALADAPTKTGWWNEASVNGVALPQPTTGADNLHVQQGPSGPTAYAAVAYTLLGAVPSATLQLKVAPNSAVGTPDVLACPTKDAAWKAGGNQPYTARPQYDCATGVPGIRAADGTTITFLLDTRQQLSGSYSLALLPAPDAVPFSVDFVKPDATSLAPDVDAAPPAEPTTEPEPFTAPPPGAGVSGAAPFGTGSEVLTAPFQAAAPVPVVPSEPVPMAAPAPVAPQGAGPTAVARPLTPVSNKERYQAGTLLALLVGALVWACQQPTPERRLIGGLSRTAPPAALAVDERPRGIGRFATTRTAAARPLL